MGWVSLTSVFSPIFSFFNTDWMAPEESSCRNYLWHLSSGPRSSLLFISVSCLQDVSQAGTSGSNSAAAVDSCSS